MRLLKKVLRFLKNPIYQQYSYPKKLRWKVFKNLLCLDLLLAITLAILTRLLLAIFDIEIGNNRLTKIEELYSPLMFVFIIVAFAPILEELLFRWPLVFLKKSSYFSMARYASIFFFGIAHIINYENFQKNLWISLLLVLPQSIGGVFLSFIRVRMGIVYSILFHATFNGILTIPSVFLKSLKSLIS